MHIIIAFFLRAAWRPADAGPRSGSGLTIWRAQPEPLDVHMNCHEGLGMSVGSSVFNFKQLCHIRIFTIWLWFFLALTNWHDGTYVWTKLQTPGMIWSLHVLQSILPRLGSICQTGLPFWLKGALIGLSRESVVSKTRLICQTGQPFWLKGALIGLSRESVVLTRKIDLSKWTAVLVERGADWPF